ncbi:MAG: hypothetical protein ABS43_31295 [Bordetella sp. SCN 67-23]|nr:hypothetical protein [Burkholderiales bacterium]ODS65827.1 MAG: hypothetical protein ABS43_31295 [Bordetella sp. SCN 67-23]OJW95107.1 MAG: hypothetical protein BGO71_03405 [Burkholderiales bacterium 67-32]
MFIARTSLSDPAFSASAGEAGLPRDLRHAFRFSLTPRQHGPVTIKVQPRKLAGGGTGPSDARILEWLGRLKDDQAYDVAPRVDQDGWTFACTPRGGMAHPCLTLRTDRLHELEWMAGEASGEGFRVEFDTRAQQAHAPTVSADRQQDERRERESLVRAMSVNPPTRERLAPRNISLAAYEYLRALTGRPIHDGETQAALQRATDVLEKVLGDEKTRFGAANVGQDIERTDYESEIRGLVQRDLARKMVRALLPDLSRYGARVSKDSAPEPVRQAMRECWPPGFLETFRQRGVSEPAAIDQALAVAHAAFSWVGGAFYCAEMAQTIASEFGGQLKDDDVIAVRWGKVHAYDLYLGDEARIRVDGWIGDADLRIPVLDEDAYDVSADRAMRTVDTSSGSQRSLTAASIPLVAGKLRSDETVLAYFEASVDALKEVFRRKRADGYRWETEPNIFTRAPQLNASIRRDARRATASLQARNTIDFELKTLGRLSERRGWELRPSTLSAIVGAARRLSAQSSTEHAGAFAQGVMALEAIDTSNAHAVIEGWLDSPRFKPWEILDLEQADTVQLLERMGEAFEQMDEDRVPSACGLLRTQMPPMTKRYPALGPALDDLAAVAAARLLAVSASPPSR